MPQISIIIPTYKRQKFLEEAIKSVLKQTFQDFEIIIVDDENSNETKTIIKNFNNKRIRYISHKNNRGVAAARNAGIKATTSQYIFFLDDDDLIPKNALENLFNHIEKVSNIKKIGALIGSMAFFIEKGGEKQFFS